MKSEQPEGPPESKESAGESPAVPAAAEVVFGSRLALAERFVDLLVSHGVERGLIGPRELPRLWDRHVLNSAALAEAIDTTTSAPAASETGRPRRVIDVGSGAGLPGVPLAIARPDLDIVLLEPMARRVDWLTEVADLLGLPMTVVRGRAEEKVVRERIRGADVVTARAVAPIARLAGWCLPLLREGGTLLALKGRSAAEEVSRDRDAIRRAGGGEPRILECGTDVLQTPTTVVVVERVAAELKRGRPAGRNRSTQQGR